MKDVIKACEDVSDNPIWNMSEAPEALGNRGQELPQQPVCSPPQQADVSRCVLPLTHTQTSPGPGRASQAGTCTLLLTPDWGFPALHQTDSRLSLQL